MIRIAGIAMILGLMLPTASFAGDNPEKWRNPKDGMVFVWIPAGEVRVQAANADSAAPFNPVTFAQGFWLGRTETTVKQFKKFAQETGYITDAERANNRFTWKSPGFKQKDSYPVVFVSSKDACEYAKWAGVDLPTEPEWLYACGAGTTTTYYWGNEMNPDLFWHRKNSIVSPHPVGKNEPNPWGLYDMVGNVWEYVGLGAGNFESRGASWTRCIRYKTRQGFIADQLISDAVRRRLSNYDLKEPPYPWDDDRGFRCIKRSMEINGQ